MTVSRGQVLAVAAIALGCQSATRVSAPVGGERVPVTANAVALRRAGARPIGAPDTRMETQREAAQSEQAVDRPEPGGVKGWVNSDACLEPEAVGATYGYGDEELWQALDFKPRNAIAGLVLTPAFEPPRALSLHRRPRGAYFFKLTKLAKNVWRRQPHYCDAPAGCLSWAAGQSQWYGQLAATRETFTRDVDASTARLFVKAWKALLARAQVVEEIGVHIGKFDGADYHFWHGASAGRVASPFANSVLGRAVLALDWLEQHVENPAAGDAEDLALIRAELNDVLTRTRNREPCLRPYDED